MHTPIAITGMGLATSLGVDVESTWSGIRAGRVGLGVMAEMESELPPGSLGGQAAGLPGEFCPGLPREARYLRWVIGQALKSATLENQVSPERCGVVLGTTLHGLRAGGRFLRLDDPTELQHFLANSILHEATAGLGLEGPAITTCSACSSSLGAIALGITMLEAGEVDVVVAGGYDAVSEYAWAGFNSLRLVAPGSVRPFAKGRQGMMLGEGYGVVVLERAEGARARGAMVMVEGWGESADAHHLTQPDPTGAGAARAIGDALGRAGVRPADISMIAAHATATPDNDAAESAAFESVWKDELPGTSVVGFKSYLGHTLGGAGAVELILSACALRSGWVPPCATVRQEDVEFEGLRVAPPGGVERSLTRTLNTSLGFGGANTCVILGRAEAADGLAMPVNRASSVSEAWITGYGLLLPGIVGAAALVARLATEPTLSRANWPDAIGDDLLAQVLNVRRVRRLGTCVKLMLASVSMALRHAGLEGNAGALGAASALLASTHGSSNFCSEYYSQIVREGVLSANPVLFAEGVPNAAAAHVSTNFGLRGACQTFIGSRTAGLDALAMAAMRVRSGACERIVVGASEETHASVDRAYRHFLGRGAANLFRTAPGSAAFIVESSESARARGVHAIARIVSHSSVSGSRVGSGAARACADEFDAPTRVLTSLARNASSLGPVLSSGHGTWIDRAEAMAARAVGATISCSSLQPVGDHFAAGPLLDIVACLERGTTRRFTALCTDLTGLATGVVIERMGP